MGFIILLYLSMIPPIHAGIIEWDERSQYGRLQVVGDPGMGQDDRFELRACRWSQGFSGMAVDRFSCSEPQIFLLNTEVILTKGLYLVSYGRSDNNNQLPLSFSLVQIFKRKMKSIELQQVEIPHIDAATFTIDVAPDWSKKQVVEAYDFYFQLLEENGLENIELCLNPTATNADEEILKGFCYPSFFRIDGEQWIPSLFFQTDGSQPVLQRKWSIDWHKPFPWSKRKTKFRPHMMEPPNWHLDAHGQSSSYFLSLLPGSYSITLTATDDFGKNERFHELFEIAD